MKNNGFTLIELLAVIVILSIIAIITVPMIMNVIDKAKLGALEDSAYGLVEAANLYYSENISDIKDKVVFSFAEGKQTSDTILKYKGNIEEGKLILNTDGKVVVCINDKTNYAYKELNETKVITGKGTCSYNGETGDFTITSDIDELNKQLLNLQQELVDLKSKGDAIASDILEGKTAIVQGNLITGTRKRGILNSISSHGWGISSSSSYTGDIYENENIFHYSITPSNSYPTAIVYTSDKIDLTNYSKIKITFSDIASAVGYGYNVNKTFGISDNKSSFIKSVENNHGQSTGKNTVTLELDVSDVNGSYYLMFKSGNGPSYTVTYEISNILFE